MKKSLFSFRIKVKANLEKDNSTSSKAFTKLHVDYILIKTVEQKKLFKKKLGKENKRSSFTRLLQDTQGKEVGLINIPEIVHNPEL